MGVAPAGTGDELNIRRNEETARTALTFGPEW